MTDMDGVAVIGLAGRFPQSPDLDQFWQNLRDGRDCLDDLHDDELQARGVPTALLGEPGYVRRAGVLDGIEEFDAEFFGFPPSVAAAMDPQQRLFLQCGWHALEDAGYDPGRHDGAIGVFAAGSFATYFPYHVLSHHDPRDLFGSGPSAELMRLWTVNDPNFMATRLAHALDLHGPAMTVQTACSSALVAVHLAGQSLLCGDSDIALAGAMTVKVPSRVGYLADGESTVSSDGYCRPFDVKANGTIFTSGGGVVVLKRLADAIADGDHVRAVIRGSAVNNDGSLKMGYTAPSVEMQAAVIAEALAVADVDAGDVGFVEAHGTGTALGDPVELAALRQAFGSSGNRCALGSVKSNIGHCEVAAGIAGLVKTVLSLEHRTLVPTVHFTDPNPELRLDDSPFFVPTELSNWDGPGSRLAGVSSLGVGGTNVHMVLEEAPTREDGPAASGPQVILLSARYPAGVEESSRALAEHLRARPDADLGDVAFTLATGRHTFQHRRAVVATSVEDAVTALDGPVGHGNTGAERVVWLFADHGDSYPGMTDALRREQTFAREWDRCAALLDLDDEPARTFAVQYALGRTLAAWGVPAADHVGIGVGEHAAACLAGKLDLADAAKLLPRTEPTAAPPEPDGLLLQVGPGNTPGAVCTMRPDGDEWETLLAALAELWTAGVDIDWPREHRARRVPLPGYPFARTRHWLEPAHTNDSHTAAPKVVEGGTAEEVLRGLWVEALGVPDVGANDNFFTLGGDSVLATRLASRARSHGLRFGPRDVFQNPTITALAAVVSSTSDKPVAPPVQAGASSEWLPLVPAQVELGSTPKPRISSVFAVDDEVTVEVLEEALTRVAAHHDALRSCLSERAGVWEQRTADPEAIVVPVIPIEPGTAPDTLPENATGDGPLRCALFDSGADRHLVMSTHAGAADQPARRILAEDLTTACQQLLGGRPVELPASTSTWSRWVEYLTAGSPGVDLTAERRFWLDVLHGAPATEGTRSAARPRCLHSTIDAAGTAELRRRQRELRVGWREIVLGALGEHLLVDVVGNARKADVETFDLARAVGRYETVYPVAVEPDLDAVAVAERLRSVPRQGLGYGVLRHLHGPSAALFGRLPKADVLLVDDGLVTAGSGRGPVRMVASTQDHLFGHALTIRCFRKESRLHLDWLYDPARRDEAEVAELRDRTVAALVALAGE